MKLTDRKATDLIRNSGASQVGKLIESYPESIAGNRTDLQILADGTSYIVSCYNNPLSNLGKDYAIAKRILQETRNGTRILFTSTGSPLHKPSEIQSAKALQEEYKRTIKLMDTLNTLGVQGRWQ